MNSIQKYKTSYTLTFIKQNNRVYNWLNGEYIEFDDVKHPFLNILKLEVKKFKKFKYKNSYDDFDWLLKNKFIIISANEIREIVIEDIKNKSEKKELNLILLPANNACNFNCVYCYEDHNQKKFMKDYEMNLLLKFIKKQNIEELKVEFFGGEPLLNIPFIKTFCKEIKKNKEIKFSSSMTTNGYLLDIKLFKILVSLNITNYQITIDGEEKDHNITRPHINKNGTYQQIIYNLKMIKKLSADIKFSIIVRVNFNQQSSTKEKRKNILNKFKKYFGQDKRFLFLFRAIGDYASANLKSIENNILCSIEESNILQKKYEREATSIGLNIAENSFYIGNGSAVCYAGKEKHIIIDSDLNVKKCTVALEDPINLVGKISTNGDLIQNQNWNLWVSKNMFQKNDCRSCFFISQCQSNNCRLKSIKQFKPICPPAIIENEESISNGIINYIKSYEG